MVYQRDSTGTWTRVGRLTASVGKKGDFFGSAIAIDGDTLVVGANSVSSPKGEYIGAVYVFNHNTVTNEWKEVTKLMASDDDVSVSAGSFYYFGIDVGISGDDLLIGAYGDTTSYVGDYSGAAYLYKRDSTTNTWNLYHKMTRSTPYNYDRTGMVVATSQGKSLLSCDGADLDSVKDAGAALFFLN